MSRGLKIGGAALLVLLLAGAGWLIFRPKDDTQEPPPVTPKLIEELIARREHVRLVVSGRLLAEIFPCG